MLFIQAYSYFPCSKLWQKVLGIRIVTIFLLLGALHVCPAQRSNDLRSRIMERIDEDQVAERIELFRSQRLEENFCFQFQLEHKPRRGRTVRYEGIMYGSWGNGGPISRVSLFPEKVGKDAAIGLSPIELIVHNGVLPKVWMRRQFSQSFIPVESNALFEPIFDGVLYTPFDLQMPFIYWENYKYEGPSRVLSRIGQLFLMYPPENSPADQNGIAAVRIAIDDTYNALLRAEVLREANQTSTRFTVRGLKKVQGYYIVKEIELKDMLTRDRTTFKVNAASIGLNFSAALFDPHNPDPVPEISADSFEIL